MNRSVDRERLSASCVAPGEMLVCSGFSHPSRGWVRCPSAPAIAGSLRHAGRRIRVADLRGESEGTGNAVVFAVSYVDRRGRVLGLAVAARRDDSVALAAAHAATEQWRRALRTRRVLIAGTATACAGARRAMVLAEGAAGVLRRPAHLLGDWPVATPGAVRTGGVEGIPDAGTVVLPAHGVGLAVRAEIAVRDLQVVDATCPLVAGVHRAVREFADRGDTVLVIGRVSDAVTDGLVGQAPEDVLVVSSVCEAGEVQVDDPDRVSFVLSPGMTAEDSVMVLAALRSRFPRLRGQHPDEWCYAASDQRVAARAVAGSCDLMLVVGEPDDRELAADVARERCPVRQLVGAGQLRPDWLSRVATVGITATSSAPAGAVDEIVQALSGLGPLSVVRRQITTEVTDGWEYAQPEPVERCVTTG